MPENPKKTGHFSLDGSCDLESPPTQGKNNKCNAELLIADERGSKHAQFGATPKRFIDPSLAPEDVAVIACFLPDITSIFGRDQRPRGMTQCASVYAGGLLIDADDENLKGAGYAALLFEPVHSTRKVY